MHQADFKFISNSLKDLEIKPRKIDILSWYMVSLMIPAANHTQSNASDISEKDASLFSNLLYGDTNESKTALNRAARRRLDKLMRLRKKIVGDQKWTVMLIIDSSLHSRSSRHVQNGQRFNHGDGWVKGHQWTNIGLLIAGQFVPLAPIAFYTQDECKTRGIEYKTELAKVSEFLRTLNLPFSSDEIVVVADSGYDCKQLESVILSRGWDFIISLKSHRTMSENIKNWKRVDIYFGDGRRPSKSIRIASYRGKKKNQREHEVKQRLGYLKDVRRQVQIVSSKRSSDAKLKFLACSNLDCDIKSILLCYRMRWEIELFHRDLKSYLGLEHAGVHSFDALMNHVHWVYLCYHLLKEKFACGIRSAQLKLKKELEIKEKNRVVQTLTQINGIHKIKSQYQSVIQRMEGYKVA